MIEKRNKRIHKLQKETYALYIAARDPRVPWYAKLFLGLILAYAFSPIDLIPDFIPILGYLDDIIIIPAGIALALKMIPQEVMVDARRRADELFGKEKPISRIGALIVISIWIIIAILVIWFITNQILGIG